MYSVKWGIINLQQCFLIGEVIMSAVKRKKWFDDWRSYVIIVIGSIITAMSINMFLVPNRIAAGGVSGIATVLFYQFGFPVGVTMLLINIPLFIGGIKYLGGNFGVKTLFSSIILSVFTDLGTFLPTLTNDPMLASLYGGMVMGVGLGIVFRAGATTGGTDLAAKIIHNFFPVFTLGQILWAIDFFIIAYAGIVFQNFEMSLFAIVTIYVSSKIIDGILEGVNFAKSVLIISNKSDRIADKIMNVLDRGVTGLKGKGMYTGQDREVLMCVLKRSEIQTLKSIVKEIDENAFIILTDAREVLGEGFKTYD